MRREEAAIGSMIEITYEIVIMEIAAVYESVAVVEKSMASGNKPCVIKNHKITAPVAAPRVPSPIKRPSDGKPHSERDRRATPRSRDVTRIDCKWCAVHGPRIIYG